MVQKARSGLVWGGGFRFLQVVSQFVLTLILARLLTPQDYGVYAVVAGIVGLLNAVTFENFIRYILQVRDGEELHYQDHFTAAVVIQFTAFAIANLVAFGLSFFQQYADITIYIHVMAAVILLSCAGGYRYVILEKQLDWKRYRILQGLGITLYFLFTLLLAFLGFGVYALIIGPSIKYLPPIFDLFFVQKWRPTWEFSWSAYRPAFHFGFNRVGSTSMARGRTMIEANVLVILTSLAAIGLLNRATGLAQLFATQLATVSCKSLYPVLTSIEPGTARYRRASGLVLRGIAWGLAPVAGFLILFAAPVVTTLFGERWTGCIPLVPWAVLLATTTTLGQTCYYLLLASCKHNRCLMYDVVRFIGLVSCLLAWPLHGNLISYLTTVLMVECGCVAMLAAWLCRLSAASFADLLAALLPPAACVVLSVLAAIPLAGSDLEQSTLFAPRIMVACVTVPLVYLVSLRLLVPIQLLELLAVVPLGRRLERILFGV